MKRFAATVGLSVGLFVAGAGIAPSSWACDSPVCRLCPPIDRVIDKVDPDLTHCLA